MGAEGPGSDTPAHPEIGVLGPLGVRTGGEWRGAGGERTAAVLALLELRRPHAVSTEALLEAGWPSPGQPPSARQSLANVVARLRAAHGAAFIDSTDSGYRLGSDVTSDREIFEAEIAEAARLADDSGAALVVLDRALGRWRGDPWPELERPVEVEADRARLLALRQRAERLQAGALVADGRAGDAVPLLRAHLDRHPEDEAAWQELSSALAGAGRRAEALRTINAARRALAAVGLTLPAALTALEGRLVADDDGTAGSSDLPAIRTELVGRQAETADLVNVLGEARLVTVHGPGGAGKTRLAREVLDVATPAFRGFVDLAAAHTGDEIDFAFGHGLGLPRDRIETFPTDARRAVLAQRASSLEGVLVVDNCEHVLDDVRDVVDRILAHPTGVVVLTTSRTPLGVNGERRYPIPRFTHGPELFRRRAEAAGHEPSAFAADTVEEICRLVDDLPLGIEIAAAQTPYRTVPEIAAELRAGAPQQDASQPEQRHRTMAATIGWSREGLDPDTGRGFVRLGVFPAAFRRSDAAAVMDVPEPDPVLDELVKVSLVQRAERGGESVYRLLAPVRQHALGELEAADEHRRVAVALADWLLAFSDRSYGEVWWRLAVADELEPRLTSLWPAVEALQAAGRARDALTLAARFAGAGHLFGHTNLLIDLLEDLLRDSDDATATADGLLAIAVCGVGAGRSDTFGHALARLDALDGIDDLPHQIFALRMNALWVMWAELLSGKSHDASNELLRQAREAETRIDSPIDRSCIELFQGWIHLFEGDWDGAGRAARRSCEAAPGTVFDLVSVSCLAFSLLHRGRSPEALELALTHPEHDRYTYFGDVLGVAAALSFVRLGRIDEGLDVLAAVNRRAGETSFARHAEDVAIALAVAAHYLGRDDLTLATLETGPLGRGPHIGHFVPALCRELDRPLTMLPERWTDRPRPDTDQAARNETVIGQLRS